MDGWKGVGVNGLDEKSLVEGQKPAGAVMEEFFRETAESELSDLQVD